MVQMWLLHLESNPTWSLLGISTSKAHKADKEGSKASQHTLATNTCMSLEVGHMAIENLCNISGVTVSHPSTTPKLAFSFTRPHHPKMQEKYQVREKFNHPIPRSHPRVVYEY